MPMRSQHSLKRPLFGGFEPVFAAGGAGQSRVNMPKFLALGRKTGVSPMYGCQKRGHSALLDKNRSIGAPVTRLIYYSSGTHQPPKLAIQTKTNLLERDKITMSTILNTYVRMSSAVAAVRDEERGATAVEYGLIVALIAAVIIGVVAILGGQVDNNFQDVSNQMRNT